jgi:two-component system OmpR family sensor kinase
VLAGGLICVGLLGVLLLVLLGRATRLELLATERAHLVEELRGAVALRDEFVAIAAHELRTPLTSLSLQLQMATRTAEPAPRIERALRQATRLGRLVDDLLNASRITAGRLTLTREPCDLAEIARETIAHIGDDARRAGCAIAFSADVPARGVWDRARLEQVVTNLLANALKFGAGSPVAVAVSVTGTSTVLTVRDRGAGIPPDSLERIFQKYERAVSARSYGGLGLGLFISREIVEAHGGSLHAESTPGQGTTLVMAVPSSPPAGEEAT